jgi:hypothetical protein
MNAIDDWTHRVISNVKAQISNEIQRSNEIEKPRKNGMIEHWNIGCRKNILDFLTLFHDSNFPLFLGMTVLF